MKAVKTINLNKFQCPWCGHLNPVSIIEGAVTCDGCGDEFYGYTEEITRYVAERIIGYSCYLTLADAYDDVIVPPEANKEDALEAGRLVYSEDPSRYNAPPTMADVLPTTDTLEELRTPITG